jgi:hypothetical protein
MVLPYIQIGRFLPEQLADFLFSCLGISWYINCMVGMYSTVRRRTSTSAYFSPLVDAARTDLLCIILTCPLPVVGKVTITSFISYVTCYFYILLTGNDYITFEKE